MPSTSMTVLPDELTDALATIGWRYRGGSFDVSVTRAKNACNVVVTSKPDTNSPLLPTLSPAVDTSTPPHLAAYAELSADHHRLIVERDSLLASRDALQRQCDALQDELRLVRGQAADEAGGS